jgi:hypothetical protein
MRKPIGPQSDEAQEEAKALAKPFDIFEGMLQEPLPAVQGDATLKPTGALVQKEDGAAIPLSMPEEAKSLSKPEQVRRRTPWVYILIVVVSTLVGILIGIAFK